MPTTEQAQSWRPNEERLFLWWRRRESKPSDLRSEEPRNAANRLDSESTPTSVRDETLHPKPESTSVVDAVEAALAVALVEATAAERWDVVAQLARELEARRFARAANVVMLDVERRREGGAR